MRFRFFSILLHDLPEFGFVPYVRLLGYCHIGFGFGLVKGNLVGPRLNRIRHLGLKADRPIWAPGLFSIYGEINGTSISSPLNLNRDRGIILKFKVLVISGDGGIHRWFYIAHHHGMRASLRNFQFCLEYGIV